MNTINFNTPENIAKTISISTVIGLIGEPFDSEGVATKTYNKHFNNPNSEYYQMSVQQIMDKWAAKGAASCHYGSLLDNYIGMYFEKADEMDVEMFKLDYDYDGDERLQGVCKSFDRFVEDYLEKHPELEFVTREQTVYLKISEGNYIKGRFDALFYNTQTNRYLIVDWKSSGSVDNSSISLIVVQFSLINELSDFLPTEEEFKKELNLENKVILKRLIFLSKVLHLAKE